MSSHPWSCIGSLILLGLFHPIIPSSRALPPRPSLHITRSPLTRSPADMKPFPLPETSPPSPPIPESPPGSPNPPPLSLRNLLASRGLNDQVCYEAFLASRAFRDQVVVLRSSSFSAAAPQSEAASSSVCVWDTSENLGREGCGADRRISLEYVNSGGGKSRGLVGWRRVTEE